ncbi:uncharacterized protein LOC128746132 [Sabethes cyaneus]|uniref:uncharacterized protein LOC128746131 n=1 Tax=Sabethes cyaneus TaxID=53552 RepID=UPI00237D4BE9|nr:uncharacterized protein LOC128746131 [Sabethes cyaneus]XP_053699155.1 uncharacterized protein LOC128746132 [Sabethes cyaneus]
MLTANEIVSKYGEEGRNLMRNFQKVAIKLAKSSNRYKFLLNCRKCKVVPNCLNYKVQLDLNNENSQRELEKVVRKHKIRILSVMVADAKRTIAMLKKQKSALNSVMERTYKQGDVRRVREVVERKAVIVYNTVKRTEQRKMEALKTRRAAELTHEVGWIENTTNTPIPEFLERTLLLGPNFNIQHSTNVPYIDVVSEIEKTVKHKENANEIRTEVTTAITNHINYMLQPRHHDHEWIAKDMAKSKKFLKENPNLIITKADKGNKTVIITAEEYHDKMLELLSDNITYRKLKTDPSAKIHKSVNVFLDQWLDRKYIDSRTYKSVKMMSYNIPRIYGLPKIHKQNRPLRPVVATIGSVTYNIAKYLASVIGKIVGHNDFHVHNSFQFAEQVTGVQIAEEDVLFSLDVTSLFTSIPIDHAMECLIERWPEITKHTAIDKESFLAIVKLVLESTFFSYKGEIFQQTFGTPMGSPLSPAIAELVMERLEQNRIETLKSQQIHLKYYRRYVDDCFCIANTNHVAEILRTFNEYNDKLRFTIENELENKLKFLDIMIIRTNNHLEMSWMPKYVDGRYLDFSSESPFSHKANTAIALIDRAIKLSDGNNRPQAIRTAKSMLESNNYPGWFINRLTKQRTHKHYNSLSTVEKPQIKYASSTYIPGLSEKLGKILRKHDIQLAYKPKNKVKQNVYSKLKDPIAPGKQTNVIYSIPCGTDDGKVYIGQTGRKLEVRIAEHKNDTKKKDARTGLAQHTIHDGHLFKFDDTRIVARIDDQETRLTAEVFHIKVLGEDRTVNLQRECGNFNTAYDGLIPKLRRIQTKNNPTHGGSTQQRTDDTTE